VADRANFSTQADASHFGPEGPGQHGLENTELLMSAMSALNVVLLLNSESIVF
jgi:hypothetical protein